MRAKYRDRVSFTVTTVIDNTPAPLSPPCAALRGPSRGAVE